VRCIASYEALLGVLVGTVLAIAVVATSLISLVIALAPIASTVPISVPWLLLGAIVTACGVIAVLGSLAPMAITNQRLANVGDNRYIYG
jgi:hypothetical protein